MSKKVVIIGGVAGGASVAARLRRLDEGADITMFERGEHVSFSNCALPFFLSRTVGDSEQLVLMSPSKFLKQYNIKAKTKHEVLKINPEQKTVLVKDLDSGKEFGESYDVLVLSPGARPVLPRSIKGIDKPRVFGIRNVTDIRALDNYIGEHNAQHITVVGAGFIGIEAAENLHHAGKKVTVVEKLNQVLPVFDYDIVQILHKEMYDKGINLILENGLSEITDTEVILENGTKIKSDVVICSIGVAAETELAKGCGIEIGETGAIRVNHNYETSIKDIYAVGDAIEVTHRITRKKTRLTLAGPAQKQARAAADAIYGKKSANRGVIGSSVIRCFDFNAASTGLNEKQCKDAGIDYDYAYIIPADKVSIMPDARPLFFKLLFARPSGEIIGAQAIGKGNADKRIDVIAAMIGMGATVEDLKEAELCYSPVYGTAKDAVNHAALVASNILDATFRQVRVSDVRSLVESGACIIDVREKREFEAGHIKNAQNIPLSELRERMDEIPSDKPVYVHCRSGQRSYNAVCALQGAGKTNVYNVSGSFLGLCEYEYFTDKVLSREPIVTAYNFK